MGASKDVFSKMREEEFIVNSTFKVKGKHLVAFENEIRSIEEINVIDYKVLRDTKELYEKDDYFKKLVKEEKAMKKSKQDYIDRHLKN